MTTRLQLELIYSGTGTASSEGQDDRTLDVWENQFGVELWMPQGVLDATSEGDLIQIEIQDIFRESK